MSHLSTGTGTTTPDKSRFTGGTERTYGGTSSKISEIEMEHGREEAEEEPEDEESTSVLCEKAVMPTLTDPTPKDILSMITWNESNLYEHLKNLLDELISTRPEDVIEYFDQYCKDLRFTKPLERPVLQLQTATRQGKMYGLIIPTPSDFDEQPKPKIVYPWDYIFYFKEMGVCLARDEMYHITLALRKLAVTEGLSKIRFWGKIFGLERSYIIAECELTPEELLTRVALQAEEDEEAEDEAEEEGAEIFPDLDEPYTAGTSEIIRGEEGGEEEELEETIPKKLHRYKKLEKYIRPPIPKPNLPQVKKTKSETLGTGVNKKIYYVCYEPGDDWVLLPNVKPDYIVLARQIKKYFKGYLSAKVDSYPPFKGTEGDLLRAQIARISAGTQISPMGYYQFGGGEEAEEMGNEAGIDEITPNQDYEPVPHQDLLQTTFWVHHTAHILRIGRTKYWLEPKAGGEEMEEEIQDEEEKTGEEIGPPLLTPLSEDVTQEMVQPWTIYNSSSFVPASSVVVVKSNLWPGAFAFSKERLFENIYYGWGLKLTVEGFNPPYFPNVEKEYEMGPEIMEIQDPTPEFEEQWRLTNAPIPPPELKGEDEGFPTNEDEEDLDQFVDDES